jgi:hypothetical protein
MTPDEMTPEKRKFLSCGALNLSGRYGELLREVLARLRNGWDESRTFAVATKQRSHGHCTQISRV